MVFDFEPTKSKEIFVGREHKRDAFAQILSDQPKLMLAWIIHIPGVGGVGKTRLLERLGHDSLAQSNLKVLVTKNLVDFYKTANQTPFGFLQTLSEEIGSAHFERFIGEREKFERLLNVEVESEFHQESERKVFEAFLQDYEKLLRSGYKIVWLLDTCEEMHAVEDFLLDRLILQIRALEDKLHKEKDLGEDKPISRQTVMVIAGRKQLDFSKVLVDEVLEWKLGPLTLEEMKEFFTGSVLDQVTDEEMKKIHDLTGGHPLYVALSYDWLENAIGTWNELLSLEEPLGEKLVKWIRRLDTYEKQAIFYSAVAWRRMEPSLLSSLLNLDNDKTQKLIKRLSKFSFVKYRPPSSNGFLGAFQLHDEMRDLVQRHVLSQEGDDIHDSLIEKIISWYKKRIGDREMLDGQKLPAQGDLLPDEARALLAEKLFYQCKLDLDKAFDEYEKLFRNAIHYLDLDFADLLNQDIERFSDNLTSQKKALLRFREALVAFRREDFIQAGYIWHSLVRQNALSNKMRATTLMLLVELDAYTGELDESLEHAQESERIYLSLLEKKISLDEDERELLKNELGQLYNNWGFTYRFKDDLDEATKYYKKALETGGRKKNIARTFNNLGYVYLLKGDFVDAKTHVGQSLQLRKGLDIPYELGLGHNTMGIIMEQSGRLENAADSYAKALRSFQEAHSERGKSLVLMNLGRIERNINRYEQAISYLEKARDVFERKSDKVNLVEVYNELGCTYRDRGQNDDFIEAKRYLEMSLELSEELDRKFDQADTLVDLSILYVSMAEAAREIESKKKTYEYISLARKASKRVKKLATEPDQVYLLAQKERTLGDLDYEEKGYDQAFEHYFSACLLMVKVKKEGHLSPVLTQRRLEQMVDRLQEQLQALPTQKETQKYTEIMLEKFNAQDQGTRKELFILGEFLDAAQQMATKIFRISE